MSNYTIRCVGFELQQQSSIVAILDLAGSALNSSWNIVDHLNSDVIMINMSCEAGLKSLAEQQGIPDYRVILVAEKTDQTSNDYWFLAKKEHGPPSLRELIQLLNQVDVCLLEADENGSSEITQPQPENDIDNYIEPVEEEEQLSVNDINAEANIDLGDARNKKLRKPTRKLTAKNYLFGMLLQAKKDKGYRIIKLNQLPTLYLSVEQNCFYFTGTEAELLQFCTASPRKLNNKTISETKFNKLLKSEENQIVAQDLDALIGYAIVIASQGRLLEGQLAEQSVTLKQTPNNNDIPVLAAYQTIAELMFQQENNLFDVAEQLQVPLSDVFNFYNICYSFEYIQVITADKKLVIPETEKNSENKNAKTLGHFLTSFFNK